MSLEPRDAQFDAQSKLLDALLTHGLAASDAERQRQRQQQEQMRLVQEIYAQALVQRCVAAGLGPIGAAQGAARQPPPQAALSRAKRPRCDLVELEPQPEPAVQARMPRNWLCPKLVTSFSLAQVAGPQSTANTATRRGKYTTGVIDEAYLFHFLKRTQYATLTPKKYRSGIRELVSMSMSAKDQLADPELLTAELAELLQARITRIGRSNWGFKRFAALGPEVPAFRAMQRALEARVAASNDMVCEQLRWEASKASSGASPASTVDPVELEEEEPAASRPRKK